MEQAHPSQCTHTCILALPNSHPSGAVDLAMRFSKNCSLPGSLVSSNSFFRAAYTKGKVAPSGYIMELSQRTWTIPSFLRPFHTPF